MSEIYDDDPRNAPPTGTSSRRSRALIITAGVIVVGFFVLTTFASFYTDRLWYRYAGYGSVFTKLFFTKAGLFLVTGLLMALAVAANVVVAYRLRPLFRPDSPEQTGLDRYRDAVTPIRTWLLVGVVVVLGVFAGTSGAGQWRTYLLWRNGSAFGQDDPYFNKDIGFYVFDLPWLHYVVDYVMAVTFVALLAAAVVHYLFGGIRLQVSRDRLSGAAQAQLSVLLGIFVLAKGVDYYLDRFDLVYQSGGLVGGITYTDDHAVLPAKNILMGIALICAILLFLNVWRRTWLLPSVGVALLALSAVLLGLIWPGVVQQFQVKPSEADKEAPYIARNIAATRTAYDINDVQEQDYTTNASGDTTTTSLGQQASSLPLVDPKQVRQTFEQLQQARAYYSVADVLDVDRYNVDGTDRALVLGVRELDQTGVPDGDRNWTNLHTVYTHGNGVIAAYANQRDAADTTEKPDIQFAEGVQAGQDALTTATGGFESRVYFGERSPDYSIVGRPEGQSNVELDLGSADATGQASGAQPTTTYNGKGGVPIGSTFRQAMYAVKYGESNFLLSQRVNADSQLLYNRTPRDRVEKVAPWLTLDDDAYPAVVDNKIVWILDGYTTSDRFPGSQRESFQTMINDSLQTNTGLRTLPTDEINYMRNAVKATVDAYDGTVTLYEWDTSDPILRAWEGAFPGTVQPKANISDSLLAHLRYPEDYYKVQRYQYARYHVTDPGAFYQGSNRWEVPVDPNTPGAQQPPYRLFLDQSTSADAAGDATQPSSEVWSLTSTFVPYQRSNLASFMSVNSDATSPDYGKIQVLTRADQQTQGPGQVANDFTTDTEVAARVGLLSRSNNTVTYGNLLTVPTAGDGLIYVEPVYATRQGSTASFPQLTFVLVSYNGQVGIGATLGESLTDALGVDTTTPPPDTGGGSGNGQPGGGGNVTVDQQITRLLEKADALFARASTQGAQGNFAQREKLLAQAGDAITKAVALSDKRSQSSGSGASAPSPSATPAPSASASP